MQEERDFVLEILPAAQTNPSWSCPLCDHAPFLNRGRFEAHVSNVHSGAAAPLMLDVVATVAQGPAKRSKHSDDRDARGDDVGSLDDLTGPVEARDGAAATLVFGLRSVADGVASVAQKVV